MKPDLVTCLSRSCVDFIACTVLGGGDARVLFTGFLDSTEVLWDATIESVDGMQFIQVEEFPQNLRGIRIGLNVTHITEPVVLKTILMVRQYKNLHAGYHEFSGRNK